MSQVFSCSRCQRQCTRADVYRGRGRVCKECVKAASRAWTKNHPERIRAHHQRERWRRKGLTPEEGQELLAQQGYRCAVCGISLLVPHASGRDRATVDHDHLTGTVRGLLCLPCNTLIGLAQNDPTVLLRAILYLKGHE